MKKQYVIPLIVMLVAAAGLVFFLLGNRQAVNDTPPEQSLSSTVSHAEATKSPAADAKPSPEPSSDAKASGSETDKTKAGGSKTDKAKSGGRGADNTQSSEEERLKALPYLAYSTSELDQSKMGVVVSRPMSFSPGLNLYCSMPRGEAYLMDMKGLFQHTWHSDRKDWQACALDKSGNIYFVVLDQVLEKIDWNSHSIWKSKGRYHNYISIADNGDILTFTREVKKIPYRAETIPILNDLITIVSPDGQIKKKISMYKLFGKLLPERRLDIISFADESQLTGEKRDIYDVFHSNAVERLDRDVKGVCSRGDLLVSIRELNLIAIVDPVNEKVKWQWGQGYLDSQHSPVMLDSGNILLLDNGRLEREYSRIIEMDPRKGQIVYDYRAEPASSFFTSVGGSVQELPNGNLLITESEMGRTFELTYKNEIVWEYYNKNLNEGGTEREVIYRMTRLKPLLGQAMQKRIEQDRSADQARRDAMKKAQKK